MIPSKTFLVLYRDPSSMNTAIFIQWAENFVDETTELRSKVGKIVMKLDGFGAHISYHALSLLQGNGIVVVELPAHSSHRTQAL